MNGTNGPGLLVGLSNELAGVVEAVGPSVVRVDDGSRLTATGVVWDAGGVILTTSHGLERDDGVSIVLADGTRHAATLAGRDAESDLAVLRIPAQGLPAIARAAEEDVKAGHIVLALGRPGESGLQATIGIIGARMDSQTNGHAEYLVNTDAVVYPGFSGGPLVNASGRMVGLTNRLFGRGRSMAIGTPIVERISREILEHGKVARGYLGVRTQPVVLPDALRGALATEQKGAVLIISVEPGTPAETAGFLLGDILLALNGRAVEDVEDLLFLLRGLRAGDTVSADVLRGGLKMELKATLAGA